MDQGRNGSGGSAVSNVQGTYGTKHEALAGSAKESKAKAAQTEVRILSFKLWGNS
jgi:hypothetical protein